MAITTLAEARTAFLANHDYDTPPGSLSKAMAFMQACRALKVLMPAGVAADRTSTQFSPQMVAAAEENAARWIAANNNTSSGGGGGGVRHFDLSNFRDGCGRHETRNGWGCL